MALNWLIGDWATGAVSEENVLPTVANGTQVSRDIHGEEEGTLSVSKYDLPNPAQWKEYLEPGKKMVVLADDTKEWNDPDAILFAGPTIRLNGKVKNTISIKAAGVLEYFARRIISSQLSGTDTNPNTGVDFKQSSFQEAMFALMEHALTPAPGAQVTPPNIISSWPYLSTGENGIRVFNSDFMSYSEGLDELKDSSPGGNEFKFFWGWESPAKNRVVLTVTVAPDNAPQLNAENTLSITLDDDIFKLVGYSETSSLDGFATRLIGQSKSGDEEAGTGADWQGRVMSGPGVLWDETFNPGVELTEAEMNTQLTQRLNFMSVLQGSAELNVVGEPSEWMGHLGKNVTITGGTNKDTSGYSSTVRIVGVTIFPGTKKLTVSIMPLQARYPKLPKPSNKFAQPPAPTNPIVPRPQSNFPGYGGGGSGPGYIPPAFDDSMTGLPEGTLFRNPSTTFSPPFRTSGAGGAAVGSAVEWNGYVYALVNPDFLAHNAISTSDLEQNMGIVSAKMPEDGNPDSWGLSVEAGSIPHEQVLGQIPLAIENHWRLRATPFAAAGRLWVYFVGTRTGTRFYSWLISAPISEGLITGPWDTSVPPEPLDRTGVYLALNRSFITYGANRDRVLFVTTFGYENVSFPDPDATLFATEKCLTAVLHADGTSSGWSEDTFPDHMLAVQNYSSLDANAVQGMTNPAGDIIYLWNYSLEQDKEVTFTKIAVGGAAWEGVANFSSGSQEGQFGRALLGGVISRNGKSGVFLLPLELNLDGAPANLKDRGGSQDLLWPTPNGKKTQPIYMNYSRFSTFQGADSIIMPFEIGSGGSTGWTRVYSWGGSKLFMNPAQTMGYMLYSNSQGYEGFAVELHVEGL